MAVAIRIKVDFLANPHGIPAGSGAVRDSFGGVRLRIKNVELVGLSAAVALLRAEIPRSRRVNDLVSAGGICAGARDRHGKRFGRPARDRYPVKAADG